MAINPKIKQKAEDIRSKIFGSEVRESLASGLEGMSEDVESIKGRQNTVESTFQSVIDETTDKDVISAPEIIAARGGHDNLSQRLLSTDQQLQQIDSYATSMQTDIFEPPVQPDINSHFSGGNAFTQSDTTLFHEYMGLFENLYLANPNYIKQFDLGADSSGWRRFKYYEYNPGKFDKTIIVGAGLHGGEKLAIVSLYAFLDLLVNHWQMYPQLAYIRNNVRLVVMPIENPSGVYANNRVNENFVDLNRNFDYKFDESTADNKGPAPMSEWATQLIDSVLSKYSHAIAYVDMHNMGPGDRTHSEIYYSPLSLDFPHSTIAELSKEITGTRVETVNSDHPMATNHALNVYGMIAYNPEYVPGNISGVAYGPDDMTRALKWFANHIIRVCTLPSKYTKLENVGGTNTLPGVSIKNVYANTSGTAITTGTAYATIPNTDHTMDISADGYVIATYNLTGYTADTVEDVMYFTPYVYQVDSTGTFRPIDLEPTRWTVYRQYFEQYANVKGRENIIVQAIVPVNTNYGQCVCELRGYSTAGNVKILRMQTSLQFVPGNRPSPELIVL